MNLHKITALITCACFVFSFIVSQPLQASIETRRETSKLKTIFDDLVIPASFGRITETRKPRSISPTETSGNNYPLSPEHSPLVINIQDLHCHPEVQRNISKIIELLDKKYNVKNIYIEGAYGPIDASWLTGIRDKELQQKIYESLIESGKITGAEYYALTSGKTDILFGIDDKKLHTDNLIRLNTIITQQDEIQRNVTKLQESIDALTTHYVSGNNKKLNALIRKYKGSKLSAQKYYTGLTQTAQSLNISTLFYSNINQFIDLSNTSKKINYKKVAKELQALLTQLKTSLPYSAYNMLVTNTANFSQPNKLYIYLPRIVKEYQPGLLASYPNLNMFFAYMEINQRLNPVTLIQEEKALVNEIRLAQAQGINEREVILLGKFAGYLKDYLAYKSTADDYEYFEDNLDQFKFLLTRYLGNDTLDTIEPSISLLQGYYNANLQRNECFLKNCTAPIPNTENAAFPSLPANDVIVLVTGGFHSKGLETLFTENGCSYMVITPNVTKDTSFSESVYTKLLEEQVLTLSSSLQLKVALAQDKTQAANELADEIIGTTLRTVGIQKTAEALAALGIICTETAPYTYTFALTDEKGIITALNYRYDTKKGKLQKIKNDAVMELSETQAAITQGEDSTESIIFVDAHKPWWMPKKWWKKSERPNSIKRGLLHIKDVVNAVESWDLKTIDDRVLSQISTQAAQMMLAKLDSAQRTRAPTEQALIYQIQNLLRLTYLNRTPQDLANIAAHAAWNLTHGPKERLSQQSQAAKQNFSGDHRDTTTVGMMRYNLEIAIDRLDALGLTDIDREKIENPKGRILIVGPGWDLGDIQAVMNKFPYAREIVAIEYNPYNFEKLEAALQEAREYSQFDFSKVTIKFGDVTKRDAMDGIGPIDMVLMSGVIDVIKDLKAFGRQIDRVLVPGGIIITESLYQFEMLADILDYSFLDSDYETRMIAHKSDGKQWLNLPGTDVKVLNILMRMYDEKRAIAIYKSYKKNNKLTLRQLIKSDWAIFTNIVLCIAIGAFVEGQYFIPLSELTGQQLSDAITKLVEEHLPKDRKTKIALTKGTNIIVFSVKLVKWIPFIGPLSAILVQGIIHTAWNLTHNPKERLQLPKTSDNDNSSENKNDAAKKRFIGILWAVLATAMTGAYAVTLKKYMSDFSIFEILFTRQVINFVIFLVSFSLSDKSFLTTLKSYIKFPAKDKIIDNPIEPKTFKSLAKNFLTHPITILLGGQLGFIFYSLTIPLIDSTIVVSFRIAISTFFSLVLALGVFKTYSLKDKKLDVMLSLGVMGTAILFAVLKGNGATATVYWAVLFLITGIVGMSYTDNLKGRVTISAPMITIAEHFMSIISLAMLVILNKGSLINTSIIFNPIILLLCAIALVGQFSPNQSLRTYKTNPVIFTSIAAMGPIFTAIFGVIFGIPLAGHVSLIWLVALLVINPILVGILALRKTGSGISQLLPSHRLFPSTVRIPVRVSLFANLSGYLKKKVSMHQLNPAFASHAFSLMNTMRVSYFLAASSLLLTLTVGRLLMINQYTASMVIVIAITGFSLLILNTFYRQLDRSKKPGLKIAKAFLVSLSALAIPFLSLAMLKQINIELKKAIKMSQEIRAGPAADVTKNIKQNIVLLNALYGSKNTEIRDLTDLPEGYAPFKEGEVANVYQEDINEYKKNKRNRIIYVDSIAFQFFSPAVKYSILKHHEATHYTVSDELITSLIQLLKSYVLFSHEFIEGIKSYYKYAVASSSASLEENIDKALSLESSNISRARNLFNTFLDDTVDNNSEVILVYDSDCDGTTAAALLYKELQFRYGNKAKDVTIHRIPLNGAKKLLRYHQAHIQDIIQKSGSSRIPLFCIDIPLTNDAIDSFKSISDSVNFYSIDHHATNAPTAGLCDESHVFNTHPVLSDLKLPDEQDASSCTSSRFMYYLIGGDHIQQHEHISIIGVSGDHQTSSYPNTMKHYDLNELIYLSLIINEVGTTSPIKQDLDHETNLRLWLFDAIESAGSPEEALANIMRNPSLKERFEEVEENNRNIMPPYLMQLYQSNGPLVPFEVIEERYRKVLPEPEEYGLTSGYTDKVVFIFQIMNNNKLFFNIRCSKENYAINMIKMKKVIDKHFSNLTVSKGKFEMGPHRERAGGAYFTETPENMSPDDFRHFLEAIISDEIQRQVRTYRLKQRFIAPLKAMKRAFSSIENFLVRSLSFTVLPNLFALRLALTSKASAWMKKNNLENTLYLRNAMGLSQQQGTINEVEKNLQSWTENGGIGIGVTTITNKELKDFEDLIELNPFDFNVQYIVVNGVNLRIWVRKIAPEKRRSALMIYVHNPAENEVSMDAPENVYRSIFAQIALQLEGNRTQYGDSLSDSLLSLAGIISKKHLTIDFADFGSQYVLNMDDNLSKYSDQEAGYIRSAEELYRVVIAGDASKTSKKAALIIDSGSPLSFQQIAPQMRSALTKSLNDAITVRKAQTNVRFNAEKYSLHNIDRLKKLVTEIKNQWGDGVIANVVIEESSKNNLLSLVDNNLLKLSRILHSFRLIHFTKVLPITKRTDISSIKQKLQETVMSGYKELRIDISNLENIDSLTRDYDAANQSDSTQGEALVQLLNSLEPDYDRFVVSFLAYIRSTEFPEDFIISVELPELFLAKGRDSLLRAAGIKIVERIPFGQKRVATKPNTYLRFSTPDNIDEWSDAEAEAGLQNAYDSQAERIEFDNDVSVSLSGKRTKTWAAIVGDKIKKAVSTLNSEYTKGLRFYHGNVTPTMLTTPDTPLLTIIPLLLTYPSSSDKVGTFRKIAEIINTQDEFSKSGLIELRYLVQRYVDVLSGMQVANDVNTIKTCDDYVDYLKGIFVTIVAETRLPKHIAFNSDEIRQAFILLDMQRAITPELGWFDLDTFKITKEPAHLNKAAIENASLSVIKDNVLPGELALDDFMRVLLIHETKFPNLTDNLVETLDNAANVATYTVAFTWAG